MLREPVRGRFARAAMGAGDLADLEETPPSLTEAWRICNEVRSVKRIWTPLPFLAIALIGLVTLLSIDYEDEFGLNEGERGLVAAVVEPFQLLGIAAFIPLGLRLTARHGPGVVLRITAVTGTLAAVFLVVLAV